MRVLVRNPLGVVPVRIGTMHDLASAVRGRRRQLGMSQARLAEQAKVSRDWLGDFEGGKRSVELALVLRVIDVLGLEISLAEAPRSPEGGTVDLDAYLDEYRQR
jgi:y4mF family transcriptional regulator